MQDIHRPTPKKTEVPAQIDAPKLQHAPKKHKKQLTIKLKLTWFKRLKHWAKTHKWQARVFAGSMALLLIASVGFEVLMPINQVDKYAISQYNGKLIPSPYMPFAPMLTSDGKTGNLTYNEGYKPASEVAGSSAAPKFSATFNADKDSAVTVSDIVNNVSTKFTPKFNVDTPKKDNNRVIYPVSGSNAKIVYTLKAGSVKQDIILDKFQKDELAFKYKVEVPAGAELRAEKDGSVSVYGVASSLLGNVTTISDKDAELLQKARQNSAKTQLLFRIPKPFIFQENKKQSPAKIWFSVKGSELTLHANKLKEASYPLSLDPSVYVETAAKLMRGNNESNIDFDIDNELIQKSQTTGARINGWTATNNLSSATWGQGTAVAGGFIYSAGGAGGSSIVTTTYYTAGSSTFSVPTGVTSITVKSWGAGGGGGSGSGGSSGGNGGGGGYAKAVLTTTPGETLDIRVGTSGAKGASDTFGGDGGGFSAVLRSGTYLVQAGAGGGGGGARGTQTGGAGGAGGAGNVSDGTVSVAGSNGGGGTAAGGGGRGTDAAGGAGGTAGATGAASVAGAANAGGNASATATSCATARTGTGGAGGTGAGGGGGNFGTNCANGGGGGGGRFGGGGGGSAGSNNRGGAGGGGGSDLTTGASQVQTAGSGVTPGNSGDTDRNGAGLGGNGATAATGSTAGVAGGVVISYTLTGATATSTISWAKFNTTTNAIESPNPGAGACTGWCTNSVYDLPVALKDLSLVAYNGFLYAIGGATGAGTPQTTVYIAKIGANGEPSLWHPSGGTPGYWYTDTALSAARSKFAAVAYNNRMYILGGLTTSATVLSSNTVQYASINPTGTLTAWTATTSLSSNRYGLTAQVYNDAMYVIGGNATLGGTPISTVEYVKLNSNGTMNTWTATSSLLTAGRLTLGGSYSTIWGGYMYVAGGCSAVNASGYCTTIATDVQIASINADGSLSEWNTILGLTNNRMGYTLIAWQGGLYRLGGCRAQNSGTGECTDTVFDVDYGVINPTGEASTVANSVNNATAPCTGASPYSCNLPGTTYIGNMLTNAAIVNGYLYIIGGCTNDACTTTIGNVAYQAIGSDGTLTKPATCPGGTYRDSYCVDSTNTISGGIAASGVAVFNDVIYLIGGTDGSAILGNIYRNTINNNGSLAGAWTAQTTASTGNITVKYGYAHARANPASAGTNPGNLYIFGGCTVTGGPGCASYTDTVYKCNITTSGAIGTGGASPVCTTTGQLQIGTLPGASGVGIGAHAGTVYANYIYLMGGLAPSLTDLDTVRYAKFDNSNNVVTVGSGWVESGITMNTGRRRGAGFGYNGYLYVVGGYDATSGVLADIEYVKLNVSDGSLVGNASNKWNISTVTINQRWGLTVPVSNSYAYVIGGCTAGASPGSCSSRTDSIQTFQIYNNDSGAIKSFTAGNTLGVDRIGGSSTISNGYVYYAGGCTAMDCSALSTSTYYATIDANGTVGSWSAGGALPTALAWGKLVAAGDSPNQTLYYVGGQTGAATTTAVGTVYFTSGIVTGNPTWNGSAATKGIGDTGSGAQARTQFGATVWDNMLFVTGGFNASGTAQTTVYASPLLDGGGTISSNWTSTTGFTVARGGHTTISYANNLYTLGGFDGTNYLNDVQFTQININSGTGRPDGTVDSWTYTTSLASAVRDADGFAANGYIYLVGGRSATTTCASNTYIAPISANTTIATGNNPTGVGAWYETNTRYTGDRYGAAAVYSGGRLNLIGGGCSSFVGSGDRMYYATVKSQPQVAKYSRLIDTDTDVFPTKWLLNGLDNSTGARWYLKYSSMTNTTTSCKSPAMTTWGSETDVGAVTLGTPGTYTPKDSGGVTTNCARFYYLSVNIDSSQAYGYPEDVNRGPTIADLSLFFTADPSKRLRHGKTFTGGEKQPLDTPF